MKPSSALVSAASTSKREPAGPPRRCVGRHSPAPLPRGGRAKDQTSANGRRVNLSRVQSWAPPVMGGQGRAFAARSRSAKWAKLVGDLVRAAPTVPPRSPVGPERIPCSPSVERTMGSIAIRTTAVRRCWPMARNARSSAARRHRSAVSFARRAKRRGGRVHPSTSAARASCARAASARRHGLRRPSSVAAISTDVATVTGND